MVLKTRTEEKDVRVEMESGLRMRIFVIQMRSVTKESLTIITIKKMELVRLAYVTVIEI